MIAGVWANSNLDDGKDTRNKMLAEIENNYKNAAQLIYGDGEEDKIDKSNPFFAAIKDPDLVASDIDIPIHPKDEKRKKEYEVDQE